MVVIAGLGLVFSGLAFVLLGYLLWDVRGRRGRLPSLTYGERVLEQRTIQWLWVGLLVIPFVASLGSGLTIASRTVTTNEPIAAPDWQFDSSWHVTIPLPFFRYMVAETKGYSGSLDPDASPVRMHVREGRLQIPLLFLIAALFYWFAVMKWPAESASTVEL